MAQLSGCSSTQPIITGMANRPYSVEIEPMVAAHWPEVRSIYLEGIATGNATFETAASDWEQRDAGHEPACRFVALATGSVVGWAALSRVSNRAVYRGVAEVSVYVSSEARRTGIGSRLLSELVVSSEREGI